MKIVNPYNPHNMKGHTMLKKDVKVGAVYSAKVSGNLTTVKITGFSEYVGYRGLKRNSWKAVNLATGREVLIKSAAKLRTEILPQEMITDHYCPSCEERLTNHEVLSNDQMLCKSCFKEVS